MTQPLLFAPVAIYGAYFGAGMGVMTLAILGLSGPGDHRTTNALKNLLNVLANVVGYRNTSFTASSLGRKPRP